MIFMPPRRNRGESEADYHARYIKLYQTFRKEQARKERVGFIVSCIMTAALISCGITVIAAYRGAH